MYIGCQLAASRLAPLLQGLRAACAGCGRRWIASASC